MPNSPFIVNIGDRVVLIRDTLMDRAGSLGIVTRKYVPFHAASCWSLTVRWTGNQHETSYPYPNGLVAQASVESMVHEALGSVR
jgi:hypothetical protein